LGVREVSRTEVLPAVFLDCLMAAIPSRCDESADAHEAPIELSITRHERDVCVWCIGREAKDLEDPVV
jgi:hypothetical protein